MFMVFNMTVIMGSFPNTDEYLTNMMLTTVFHDIIQILPMEFSNSMLSGRIEREIFFFF